MGIRDFLDKFKGEGKNKLTRSDDGEIVTLEKKQKLDIQKAEEARIEAKEQEKKLQQDIRQALSILTDSPIENPSQKQKSKDNKLKQPVKPVKQPPKPQSKSKQPVDIYDDINIPIDDKTIPPDCELHKYAAEAIALLDNSIAKDNHIRRREDIKLVKKPQSTQKRATGFDIDDR